MMIDGIHKTDYSDPEMEQREYAPGITFQDVMDELEKRNLNVKRTQRDLGIPITHQVYHTTWRDYLSKKYPMRFGAIVLNTRNKIAREKAKKSKAVREFDDFLAVTEIPCMEEGCNKTVTLKYERSQGIPRIKKRCSSCAARISGLAAGNFEIYSQQIRK